MAPPRRLPPSRPHPHHKQSLLQYLFPRSLSHRYRERLIGFHLDTFPYLKHQIQSRIYRLILDSQRRRRDQSRLVDHARRFLLGPPTPKAKGSKNAPRASVGTMTSTPGYGGYGGYGAGSGNYGTEGVRERGARRKKLAAMAGSMYRAGATAVNEIKESYYQTRSDETNTPDVSRITIPGSFPDVAIVTKGNEQMVLFPSYAKRHVREEQREFESPAGPPHTSTVGMNDQDYWRNEWSRHEDEKAIVDVDVRGWIYNPQKGQMTRRNRLLIGLARQLSGIPAPKPQQTDSPTNSEPSLARIHQEHEEKREQERIAREAKEIERKGKAEEEAAQKGSYSERPRDEDSESERTGQRPGHQPRSRNRSPSSAPSSPTLRGRTSTAGGTELDEAELAIANANLMARIAPFMTTPLVEIPITLFFYNDTHAQSRTVKTNDSGHFMIRAALDFVPTHVRVLASEDISCTEPVQIIEPTGVSLISDIDDTVKRSNIALGAKEIFRNTFIRDLGELTVDGVKDWYNTLHQLGVRIHYCSNSPWQLYPVLATYFKMAGLPPGSLHLKQYTGMLQGIFEPVAERKKGTLERIMKDFPERKFLLVGDSGEADLEVYTELAIAHPGSIVAIFIRDVTTPEETGYFDSGFGTRTQAGRITRKDSSRTLDQTFDQKPLQNNQSLNKTPLPSRVEAISTSKSTSALPIGDLIDFSQPPEPGLETAKGSQSERTDTLQPSKPANLLARKPPPPKPAKPSSLQSTPAATLLTTQDENVMETNHDPNTKKLPPPTPPPPRKASQMSNKTIAPSPLAQMQRSSEHKGKGELEPLTRTRSDPPDSMSKTLTLLPPPPLPPPRRRGTPSSTTSTKSTPSLAVTPPGGSLIRRRTEGSEVDFERLPPPINGSTYGSDSGSTGNQATVTKKVELWHRRLQRAHDTLDHRGVALYTWRRGGEVVDEAVGIVKRYMGE